jgi:hypothetical protein
MRLFEEHKPKCTQKHKESENCCLCAGIDVLADLTVQPSSCLVVRGKWTEHDIMDDTGEYSNKNRTGRNNNPSAKRRVVTKNEKLVRPAKSAEVQESTDAHMRLPAVRSRLSSQNISATQGESGPAEIGPGKHRQTKTSELRGQWMRGGYSLPSISRKHLKEFNRLPFISSGNESRCFEMVSDRVQRLNLERKEELIIKYNRDPHFSTEKPRMTQAPVVEKETSEGTTTADPAAATGETTLSPVSAETTITAVTSAETTQAVPASTDTTITAVTSAETTQAVPASAEETKADIAEETVAPRAADVDIAVETTTATAEPT